MSDYGYTRIRVGDDWVEPSEIYRSTGSSWEPVRDGWVWHGNEWRKIWPPRGPQRSDTYDAVSTALWHDYSEGYFGGTWGTQPEQGAHPVGNHRGMWFYGNRPWASHLAEDGGRKIVRIEMFLHRVSGHLGWGSAGGVRPRLWWHEHNTQPGARPAFFGGPFEGPALQRNESRWIDLPLNWASVLLSGRARGFGVHTPSGGPNAAFRPRSEASSAGRIRITHA